LAHQGDHVAGVDQHHRIAGFCPHFVDGVVAGKAGLQGDYFGIAGLVGKLFLPGFSFRCHLSFLPSPKAP